MITNVRNNAEQREVMRTDLTMIVGVVFFLLVLNTIFFSSITQMLSISNLARIGVIMGSVAIFGVSYYYVRSGKNFERGKMLMKWAFLYLGFSFFIALAIR